MTVKVVPAGAWIGCAGWSIPAAERARFAESAGTHLQRYASRFPAVEINSSFHRPHKKETYARWAGATPADFRFSVKLPKTITHRARLLGAEALLDRFLAEISGLGDKLGCLLVQLPPSLVFESETAERFFAGLRERSSSVTVCEPRHATWFEPQAAEVLFSCRVARVAADPACVVAAREPGGWPGVVYVRLHGQPRTYYSAYPTAELDALASRIAAWLADAREVWCIFDNTALGAATANAWDLRLRMSRLLAVD